jgi:hypothetical protein
MLGEQVTAGNPQLFDDQTIGLNELGISRFQSHRWQLSASVGDNITRCYIITT